MTGGQDVNQEVKTGSEKCNCAIDPEWCSGAAHTFKNEFYIAIFLLSGRKVEGDADS